MVKLYIFCGIPFAGKSTIAEQLSQQPGFIRIDLDEIKFQMYGKKIKDDELIQTDWDKIYQEMYKQIKESLAQGKTVIHDTGNFTRYERGLISDIAKAQGLEYVTVFVNTPLSTAKKHWLQNKKEKKRFDISEKSFMEAVKEMEPPGKDERTMEVTPDTDIKNWVTNIIQNHVS